MYCNYFDEDIDGVTLTTKHIQGCESAKDKFQHNDARYASVASVGSMSASGTKINRTFGHTVSEIQLTVV